MSWSTGLALWILGALVAMWLYGKLVDGGKRGDTDHLAERKRRLERNGFKSRMGVK